MSARSTISVFACGMSSPDSMIVVDTSTSASPARKANILSSSSRPRIWPCAPEDVCFGGGYLAPRLDDRRRHEHVGVAGEEGEHLVLQLALRHLAVRDEEADAGAQLLQLLRGLVDRLDAVVEVERLPATRDLAFERLLDQLVVVLA